ncbi:uncharacterized protein LOC144704159 [Wolffia australiana]
MNRSDLVMFDDDNHAKFSVRKLASEIWRRQLVKTVNSNPHSACACKPKNRHLISKRETANLAMEKTTKWDQNRRSEHINQPHPTALGLRRELDRARSRVTDLEAECDLWREKLRFLFAKTLERKQKEEEIAGLQAELIRERKERKLQEALNWKLAGDVVAAEAKLRRSRRASSQVRAIWREFEKKGDGGSSRWSEEVDSSIPSIGLEGEPVVAR